MVNQQALLAAARIVQSDLRAAESATDAVLAQAGRLTTTLSTTRLEAELPPIMGQQAMTHVTQAMARILEARELFVAAHRCCVKEGKVLLPTVGWGDDGDCPPVITPEATPQLRAVA